MNDQNGKFSGSWRTVAVVSSVICLGLIGALVTIAYVGGADALSTIALTLAVIAFIAQLVIFTIQTTHSAAQLREAQDLNRATLEVLGDTRSRIDTTYQMVSNHNEMLLRINSAKAQEPQGVDLRTSSTTVSPAFAAQTGVGLEEQHGEAPFIDPTVHLASTWPDPEKVEEALGVLESLSEKSVKVFTLNLASHLLSVQADVEDDILFSKTDIPLVEKGLVREVEHIDRPSVAQVTEHGRATGRILVATWPPPHELESFRDRLLQIREHASPRAVSGFHSLSAYKR